MQFKIFGELWHKDWETFFSELCVLYAIYIDYYKIGLQFGSP